MSAPDTIRVRRPTLTGYQQVAALWFPAERFSERERAGLIIQYWQADASAFRFAQGDLLRFPASRAMSCEELAGWPLIRQGRTLCSAQLIAEEMQHLTHADIWLVRGTQVDALHLRDAVALAPGQWIDIGPYALLDTYDCRDALPEPQAVPLEVTSDIREILGDRLSPVSPEQATVMQALRERQDAQTRPAAATKPRSPDRPGKLQSIGQLLSGSGVFPVVAVGVCLYQLRDLANQRLRYPTAATQAGGRSLPGDAPWFDFGGAAVWTMIIMALLILALLAVRTRDRHRGTRPAAGHEPCAPASAASRPEESTLPPRASRGTSGPSRWRRLLTRLIRHSRLSALYGKRQAAYMQRMLEMFETGDLQEALRHAIPLDAGEGNAGQAFGTPTRRQDLTLSQHSGPGKSMLVEADLEGHLRRLYRQSFERLDREGRVEEAVFVLAELLRTRQEALDYLEKHERHRQAAELALAWDMPASTIVRLLCLAEDWQRALKVARRDDAFADAVILLEKRWPEASARLRVEWALALTDKGLWLQAVDAIWSLPTERKRAGRWLLAAEAAGGSLAMGALVKRAILLPDTLASCGGQIEKLRDDPGLVSERAALAKALLAHKAQNAALAWLAAAVVRAILCDQAGPQAYLHQNELHALVKMSKDKLLQADLPGGGLPRNRLVTQSLDRAAEPLWFSAPDRGNRPIRDAVPLLDGRQLLALGEAGALVVEADGRNAVHFPVPAYALVLGHSRQVALALARRGDVWRISKLDLVNRSASDLGVLMLDVFARTFDGTGWTIGRGTQLRVVDVDRRFETLWHVSDLPGRVSCIQDDPCQESVLLHDAQQAQLWHYRLPNRQLLSRDPVPAKAHDQSQQTLDAAGKSLEYWVKYTTEGEPVLMVSEQGTSKGYRLPGLNQELTDLLCIFPFNSWLVVCYSVEAHDVRWHFIHRSSDRLCAVLHWPVQHAQIRRAGNEWVVFDHEGRLCHIDAASSLARSLSVQ